MATDNNQMTDEVVVEHNGEAVVGAHPDDPNYAYDNLPSLEDAKPAESASVSAWVDYCVSLGADRTFLTEETVHHDHVAADGQTNVYVTEPKLTKAELQELATRLGG